MKKCKENSLWVTFYTNYDIQSKTDTVTSI